MPPLTELERGVAGNRSGRARLVLAGAGLKKGRQLPPPCPLPRERENSRQSVDETNGCGIDD